MRESLSNSMFPLLCENINTPIFNSGPTTFISSNGYYGYQPQIHTVEKTEDVNEIEEMSVDVPINNNNREENYIMQIDNARRPVSRKRRLEHAADVEEFKKRRDTDAHLTSPQKLCLPPQVVHLRKPTHNIPDLPRCTMGHYV